MMPFKSKVIYSIHIGNAIIRNSLKEKYKFNDIATDVRAINITVIGVSKTDAGIYRAEKNTNVDGCCLLIVTGMILTLLDSA